MGLRYRLFSCLFIVFGIVLLFSMSCGKSSSKNPSDGGSGNDNETSSGFIPDSEQAILDNAEATFTSLAKTGAYTAARETLIKQLNATPGVKSATLFEDGYTVWVTFADSSCGIVNTIDSAKLAEGLDSISYSTLKTAVGDESKLHVSPGKRLVDPYTPTERKVLILDIAEPSVPCAAHIQRMKSLFLNYGWEDSDITVKIRSSQTDKSITPQDMFSLSKYGVVLIYAHGAYGRAPGSTTTTGYHYIQLCSTLSKADTNAELYKKWYAAGQLVPSSDGVYIRNDLLMQQLQHMPSSIVYLCTCWGWYARNAFISNGCGAFLGWDDIVMYVDSFPSVNTLFNLMGRNDPATNVSSAYNSDQLTKTSKNYEDRTAKLQLRSNELNLYLPTWAEVSTQTTSLPEGTDRVAVGVQWQNKNLGGTVLDASNSATIYNLVTGEVVFTAMALKGEQTITTVNKTVSLHAGKNAVNLSFSSQIAKQMFLAYTYPSTDWEGRVNTRYLTYWIWKQMPGVESYRVVNHNDSPQETKTIAHYKTGDWTITNKYLTRDDLITKYGSNIFSIKSDEVVYVYEGGGHYDHRPDDQEALDGIQFVIDDCEKRFKDFYLEVFTQ